MECIEARTLAEASVTWDSCAARLSQVASELRGFVAAEAAKQPDIVIAWALGHWPQFRMQLNPVSAEQIAPQLGVTALRDLARRLGVVNMAEFKTVSDQVEAAILDWAEAGRQFNLRLAEEQAKPRPLFAKRLHIAAKPLALPPDPVPKIVYVMLPGRQGVEALLRNTQRRQEP